MKKDSKIYVAGHTGMAGSSILRLLKQSGYENIVYKTSKQLDLRNQKDVEDFFSAERPDFVFLAAARVGGIFANNTFRADFIYDNLIIETNVIHYSWKFNVKKLLFLGSSCIYPKISPQPIKEEYLLNGYLESTNQPYAIAKIAGIELCNAYRSQYGTNFISLMPSNLYGPNDNYHVENSHVLPALLRKFIVAKNTKSPFVEIWGTGMPKREFLHVDDLADACLFLMLNYNHGDIINVGVGKDISILDLALLIQKVVGYKGEIVFDKTKPDGTFQKLLDISRISSLGWNSKIELEDGLAKLYLEMKNQF